MAFTGIWIALVLILHCLSRSDARVEDLELDTIAEEYEKLNQQSLNWGPYRSNLYLGIRSRIPESILTGLIWFPAESFKGVMLSKHSCDQKHDIEKFGWTKYDPRYGGIETIVDNDSQLKLTASFVKTEDGKNWALRINGKATSPESVNSVVFYAGLPNNGKLELETDYFGDSNNLLEGLVTLKGESDALGGKFSIDIIDDEGNVMPESHTIDFDSSYNPSLTHHVSLAVPNEELWKASEIFWTMVRFNVEQMEMANLSPQSYSPTELFQLRNSANFSGNMHFVQKTFVGDFQYDIIYNSVDSNEKIEESSLKSMIQSTLQIIDTKFTKKFQLNAPFNTNKYVEFAKEILSQLLGGIIYLNGDQVVDRSAVIDDVNFAHSHLKGSKEGPHELFTCVPSRPFFPRGFYWDEGFHLLPVLQYDSDLTLEIVKSWFSLIDDKGWIAREQILGDEARSKVPEEFTVQNPNIANPPTLMLIFSELLDSAKRLHLENQQQGDSVEKLNLFSCDELRDSLGDLHMEKPQLMIAYAEEIYSKLQKHYEWFRRTQRGNVEDLDRKYPNNEEVYRWKGRTRDHCLPSGIDDYPRCEADIGELNVDLISWMGVMTRAMLKIAQLLDRDDDAKKYKQRYDAIIKNIDTIHWSEEENMFCDVTVDDEDEDVFECHDGYVSIMPFIHKLISNSDTKKLTAVIESLNDKERLWSEYGIRSLSKKDPNFHTSEDYWRGHVWINLNYLTLEALYHYGSQQDVDADVRNILNQTYTRLRENIVNNVYNEYDRTGYAWEQYNEETGSGQRTRHFLGWTSLVILMMKMPKEII